MLSFFEHIRDVLRIALPLIVSAGAFSLVLFTDRTMLMNYDGVSMSASMAAGNVYWVIVCVPVGIAGMSGAIIAQYIGSKRPREVGPLMWQAVWMSLGFIPFLALAGYAAPYIFRWFGQPDELLAAESTYLRLLMFGGLGMILENALAGFFSGTERTATIMYASVLSAVLNIGLDYWFIFGGLGLQPGGIAGAAIASNIAFWFKVVFYAAMLTRPSFEPLYAIRSGCSLQLAKFRKLLYFGLPAGIYTLAESGTFTWIVLQIGRLGDTPLRATTMAINFNMVAFIPLVGLQVATSVLVGRHLTESGADRAAAAVRAALVVATVYCAAWATLYTAIPETLMSVYGSGEEEAGLRLTAQRLLWVVTAYMFLDALQVTLSGALRGAGDTWFVLGAFIAIGLATILLGQAFEAKITTRWVDPLYYWWLVLCGYIWLLGCVLGMRYLQGRWRTMRMV